MKARCISSIARLTSRRACRTSDSYRRSLLEVAYDPLELNPDLDLSATTQVVDRGVPIDSTVTMSLQGPAQSAAPQFESTPALSFNRIVNLLAFGTTDVSNFNYGGISTPAGRLLSKRAEEVGIDESPSCPPAPLWALNRESLRYAWVSLSTCPSHVGPLRGRYQ